MREAAVRGGAVINALTLGLVVVVMMMVGQRRFRAPSTVAFGLDVVMMVVVVMVLLLLLRLLIVGSR